MHQRSNIYCHLTLAEGCIYNAFGTRSDQSLRNITHCIIPLCPKKQIENGAVNPANIAIRTQKDRRRLCARVLKVKLSCSSRTLIASLRPSSFGPVLDWAVYGSAPWHLCILRV